MMPPIPLRPDAERRIRAVVRHEARLARLALAEAALHGGFSIAAIVWVWLTVAG
jgi:hypothetical protein